MNDLLRNASRLATAIVALSMSLCLAPSGQAQSSAQAQADSSAASTLAGQAVSNDRQSNVTGVEFAALDQQDSAPTTAPAPAATSASPTPAAAPTPLPMPSMSGPLQTAAPHEFPAGPFGNLEITGILSGMGWSEGNAVAGDTDSHFDVSNAQIFVQKTTGWWQFYLQGGAYNLPALGAPFLSTTDTMKNIYGPFPQGYLKLVKGNFSAQIGALPTLIGAEYTFTFENMNVERGLLWNQENAVNRGIQLNETYKKLNASLSWNDGFYSNRYTWLTGSISYAPNASNTIAFVAGGNAGQYAKSTAVTPLYLNNEQIYNVIYTYSHESWMIQPYFQYTNVPTLPKVGITKGASTTGGALLLTYNFKHGVSLAARPEYITTSGSASSGSINLLYGPGSGAFGFTVTPSYRKDDFFVRADFSVVHATSSTPGLAFGPNGVNKNQPRGVIEAGFMF